MASLCLGVDNHRACEWYSSNSCWSQHCSQHRTFSPKTVINELPSKWTVRHARTVLYVIVQTLDAYCLDKSKKWHQAFTDGTGRRQVAMQNLLIDIEEELEDMK